MLSSISSKSRPTRPLLFFGGAALALSLCALGCESKEQRLAPEPGRSDRQGASASPAGAETPSPAEPTDVSTAPATAPAPAPRALEAKATPKAAANTPVEPTEIATGEVKVSRLVVTRRIEAREPVVGEDIKTDGAPVFAFLELENSGSVSRDVVVTFEHETGKRVGHVKLNVPGKTPRWRTWGQTRLIRDTGTWTAVIRSDAGEELGRHQFEVSPS